MKTIPLENTLPWLLKFLLFLLPFQTIWIWQEIFVNGTKWELATTGIYATEILLWFATLLSIFWLWHKKNNLKIHNLKLTKERQLTIYSLLFTAYCLLSFFWSPNPELAWQQGLRIMSSVIFFFLLFLYIKDEIKIAKWFVASSVLPSLLGLYQFFTQSTIASKWLGLAAHPVAEAGSSVVVSNSLGRFLRAYGSLPHPNVFGGFLSISIFVNLFLISKADSKRHRTIYLSILIIQTATLFFTFSRSAWLASTGFALLALYNLGKKKLILASIASQILLVTILSIIYFPLIQTRINGANIQEATSTTERVDQIAEAKSIIKNNLWLGTGAGNYTAYLKNKNPNLSGWQLQPVHNVPLLMLAELGIAGLLLLTLALRMLLLLVKEKTNLTNLSLLFTAYCLLFVFDHYIYSSFTGLLLTSFFVFFAIKTSTKTRQNF